MSKGGGDVPSNASRSLEAIPASESNLNLTTMTFYVRDGTYHYSVTPAGDFWDPQVHPQGVVSGLVRVAGGDIQMNLTVVAAAC